MKHAWTMALALLFAASAFAQKTEVNICLNSGLFSFSGASAEKVSSFNYNEPVNKPYTNNPWGSGSGLSYGLSGNIKRVLKCNLIFGGEIGYEQLRNRVDIDRMNVYTGSSAYEVRVKGHANLNYNCINLHPFIGYRINAGKIGVDVTGGLDISYILSTTEKGKAIGADNVTYKSSVDRLTISTDIRPRVQLAANYDRYGIYVGYSLGLLDYKQGFGGTNNECYARFLRFGMTCRLL